MKEPIEIDILQQVTAIVDKAKEVCPFVEACYEFKPEIIKEEHEGNETRYFLTCKNYTDNCRKNFIRGMKEERY